jgi:hypothetical protein
MQMRYLIGLFLPFAFFLLPLPYLATAQFTVLGVPALFFWLSACIPITSVCLFTCWHLYDRKDR